MVIHCKSFLFCQDKRALFAPFRVALGPPEVDSSPATYISSQLSFSSRFSATKPASIACVLRSWRWRVPHGMNTFGFGEVAMNARRRAQKKISKQRVNHAENICSSFYTHSPPISHHDAGLGVVQHVQGAVSAWPSVHPFSCLSPVELQSNY